MTRSRAASARRPAVGPLRLQRYCGFTWFTAAEVERLAAAGTPTVRHAKRHRGDISEWVAEDGSRLVVAEDAVRWADLLAVGGSG